MIEPLDHLGVRRKLCYLENHTVLRWFPVSVPTNSLAIYGTSEIELTSLLTYLTINLSKN